MVMDNDVVEKFNNLTLKLGEIDRKLDFLFKHLHLEFVDGPPVMTDIEKLIADGDRIGAIKLYIQKHKVDMIEAKNAIENIIARLGL